MATLKKIINSSTDENWTLESLVATAWLRTSRPGEDFGEASLRS